VPPADGAVHDSRGCAACVPRAAGVAAPAASAPWPVAPAVSPLCPAAPAGAAGPRRARGFARVLGVAERVAAAARRVSRLVLAAAAARRRRAVGVAVCARRGAAPAAAGRCVRPAAAHETMAHGPRAAAALAVPLPGAERAVPRLAAAPVVRREPQVRAAQERRARLSALPFSLARRFAQAPGTARRPREAAPAMPPISPSVSS
jgi:hypothetical protein